MISHIGALQSNPRVKGAVQSSATAISSTRWLFLSLCVFLGSQIYLIPITPIGPWAFWPRIADLAFLLMAFTWLFVPRSTAIENRMARRFLHTLWFVVLLTTISYVSFTVLGNALRHPGFLDFPSVGFGLYSWLRLVQFVFLAQFTLSIPMNNRRWAVIRSLLCFVVFVSSALCLATFSSVITTSDLSTGLPSGPAAGAWWAYQRRAGQGLGAIGYNHGYVATQLLLLTAFTIHLLGKQNAWLRNGLLLSAGLGILVSGSRSGLLSFSIYVVLLSLNRLTLERLVGILLGIIGLFGLAMLTIFGAIGGSLASILERQTTAFQFVDPDNLSGRADIWRITINALKEGGVLQWLFGHGLGATMDLGRAAHNLPLTYLMDFGLLGLLLLASLFALLLMKLFSIEGPEKSMTIAIISLLIGSLSQETFYPSTWNGHFLGLFLVFLVLTFMHGSTKPQLEPKKMLYPSRQTARLTGVFK